MILLALIVFLISFIFLSKATFLNKWVTCFVLNGLNDLIQAKVDILTPDDGVIHAGYELAMEGDSITRMSANSYAVHFKITLSRSIKHKQSSQSIIA